VRYWLDAFDRVAAFDQEWPDFASADGAADLTEEHVLGRSVYSFISDESVRHGWELLLRRARPGVVVQVPIRCDSPEFRRTVEILVTMDGPDRLLITTDTVSSFRRPAVGLLRSSEPRAESSVRTGLLRSGPDRRVVSSSRDHLTHVVAVSRQESSRRLE
jgi:hypothetical protein